MISSEKVSVLFGGKGLTDLKEHTPDMSVYQDPMKVLHNTLFPEDKDIYGQDFNFKSKVK